MNKKTKKEEQKNSEKEEKSLHVSTSSSKKNGFVSKLIRLPLLKKNDISTKNFGG